MCGDMHLHHAGTARGDLASVCATPGSNKLEHVPHFTPAGVPVFSIRASRVLNLRVHAVQCRSRP